MDSEIYSQIRILDSSRLRPFEFCQPANCQAPAELSELPLLRHPFLTTPLEDDSYLLLEETAAFQALVEAGLKHVPVQICPEAGLRFISQTIGLTSFGYDDLLRLAARYPRQIAVGRRPGRAEGPTEYLNVSLKFGDRPPVDVQLRHSSRTGCPLPLEYLFRSILRTGRYLPVVELPRNSDTVTRKVSFTATLSLPSFSIDDLKTAALADRLFPAGIVRVGSSFRILEIDFPMSVLTARISIAEKEAFLRELVMFREQALKTSFYEGRIYLLNR